MKLNTPKLLEEYIKGLDSMPSKNDLESYKKNLEKFLEIFGNYITLYRGFSSPLDKYTLGEIFFDESQLISFTECKNTAIEIAQTRSEDLQEYGYAIEIKIPISKVYFHYRFDEIGNLYPSEKEVIVNPYGYDWEIIQYVEPNE